MIIKDITQNKLLTTQAKEAKSLKDKMFGLTLKKNPRFMLFKTRFGIHTLGMREKIDVLVLNKTNHIVSLKPNLKPFRSYFWSPKHNKVLELPGGTIEKLGLKPGDLIRFS